MMGAKLAIRKTKCERIASKVVLYIEENIIIKYKLHKKKFERTKRRVTKFHNMCLHKLVVEEVVEFGVEVTSKVLPNSAKLVVLGLLHTLTYADISIRR